VFALATAAIAVDTLMFSAIVPALPVYQREMGLSDTGVALIFAAFPVAQLLVALLLPRWVDRAGRRRALALGAMLLAASGVAFAFAGDPATLAIARAVQGGAAALTWTGALAAVSDVYPTGQLGFRLGLAETAGGGVGLLGPLVSGVLIDAVGVTETFLIVSVVPVILALCVLLVPETARPSTNPPSVLAGLRSVARSPGARAGGLALILLALVEAMLEPLLPLDLSERLGLSSSGIGLVLALGTAALFLGSPLGGWWSDHAGRRLPLIVGGAITAVALPFVALGPPWWVTLAFAVCLVGAAVLAAPAGPLFTEAVDDMGHAGSYGLSAAAMVVVYSVGYTLGPLVGGGLQLVLSFQGVTIAVAAVVAVGTVCIALMIPRS
jgi:MFS family permease